MRRTIAIFLTLLLVLTRAIPVTYAQTAPSAPGVPSAPTPPPSPDDEEVPPPSPTPPPPPTVDEVINPSPTPTPTEAPVEESGSQEPEGQSTDSERVSTTSEQETEVATDTSSGESSGETTGHETSNDGNDPYIETGDANSSAVIVNDANTNVSTGPSVAEGESGGISVVNEGNGTGSENTGSATVINNSTTIQDNSANVVNDLDQMSNSGDNKANYNVGDATIITGDANASGTIINTVNTNIDGVAVVEFNIIDDHMGDFVLDLEAGCVSGCGGGDIFAGNSGNGTDSENLSNVDVINNDATFQTNDANVENNMILTSNTGYNKTNDNTASDTSIETGDANVSANILNFVNNNIAGGVVYTVVNIFGDLVGDIIFPEDSSCCFASTEASNTGNGTDSTNTANVDQSTSNELYQFNTASIENNLVFDATTGENVIRDNTMGGTEIVTGDSSIDARVVNIVNTNVSGENMWLVLVNEAGKWIGRILGSSGGNLAGSEGFEFTVNEAGEVTAVNSGNGLGSENTSNASTETNNTIVQTNNANIVNNVHLTANTGGNKAIGNTGGDNSIETGDAHIVANIVNFVNNNIVGTGKLFVTVINVFGSWMGDFVSPGYQKEVLASDNSGTGGATQQDNSDNNETEGSTDSHSDNGSVNNESVTSTVASYTGVGNSVFGYRIEVGSDSSEQDSDELAFAGDGGAAQQGDKVIKVNLAWAIILLPLVLGYITIRKRERILKLLPAKKK